VLGALVLVGCSMPGTPATPPFSSRTPSGDQRLQGVVLLLLGGLPSRNGRLLLASSWANSTGVAASQCAVANSKGSSMNQTPCDGRCEPALRCMNRRLLPLRRQPPRAEDSPKPPGRGKARRRAALLPGARIRGGLLCRERQTPHDVPRRPPIVLALGGVRHGFSLSLFSGSPHDRMLAATLARSRPYASGSPLEQAFAELLTPARSRSPVRGPAARAPRRPARRVRGVRLEQMTRAPRTRSISSISSRVPSAVRRACQLDMLRQTDARPARPNQSVRDRQPRGTGVRAIVRSAPPRPEGRRYPGSCRRLWLAEFRLPSRTSSALADRGDLRSHFVHQAAPEARAPRFT